MTKTCAVQAPYHAYEFGKHCVQTEADLILVPMAWTKSAAPEQDDGLHSIRYWLSRLGPVLDQNKRSVFVAAGRVGTEGLTTYQGGSCVVAIDHGDLTVLGKLDFEEEALLVVDVSLT